MFFSCTETNEYHIKHTEFYSPHCLYLPLSLPPSVGTSGMRLVANSHPYNANRRPLQPLRGITLPSVKSVHQKCSQMDILLKSEQHTMESATWWHHNKVKFSALLALFQMSIRQTPKMASNAELLFSLWFYWKSCWTTIRVPNGLRRHDTNATS